MEQDLDSILNSCFTEFNHSINHEHVLNHKKMLELDELVNSFKEIKEDQYNTSSHLFNPTNICDNKGCLQNRINKDGLIDVLNQLNIQSNNDNTQCILYINKEEYDTDSIEYDLATFAGSNIMSAVTGLESKQNNEIYNVLVSQKSYIMLCTSVKRICQILINYNQYIHKKQLTYLTRKKKKSIWKKMQNVADKYFGNKDKQKSNQDNDEIREIIYNKISDTYSNINLLNDFNHLIHEHSSNFEDIYNILSEKVYQNRSCDLSTCLLIQRNQRDRTEVDENANILNSLYFTYDNKQRITQQFIDRIHCHFFHSFDIGYRISKTEREQIINDNRNVEYNQYIDDEKYDDIERTRWIVGNKVQIYSESQQKWFNGEIMKVFNDPLGEWLVIDYAGHKSKEIQRFSKYIRPLSDHINKDKFVCKISELIKIKRDKYRNIQSIARIYNKQNKFVSTQYKSLQNGAKNILNEYRFGFRFFYHNYYKYHNGDSDPAAPFSSVPGVRHHPSNFGYPVKTLYIEAKHQNFKTELLENNIYGVGCSGWDNLYRKAVIQIQTECARKMVCHRTNSAKYYDMRHKEQIQMEHLMAAMAYCGYDELQKKFSETFRRTNNTESINDIKEKHRNYYFFGRLLRECVECFGMKHNNNDIIRLYHGINNYFMFKSLFGYIKGSFSTTTSYEVSVNFSANIGMILELNIDTKSWILQLMEGSEAASRITCFDMQWLSDYSNENEIFCIGGLNRFYFKSIIEAQTGINYGIYIEGLRQMTSGMSEKGISADSLDVNIPTNRVEQQMVYRLLAHQFDKHMATHKHAHKFKACPKYIDQLMEIHCNKVKYIQLNQKKHHILDCMLRIDNEWIDFDAVTTIFPNANHIKYYAYDKDLKFLQYDENNKSIYDSILSYIDQNVEYKINIIDISIPKKLMKPMKQFMSEEYEHKFRQRDWTVNVYYYDPIEKLSESLGFSVKEYIEKAKKNDSWREFVDSWLNNTNTKMNWLGTLLRQAGVEMSNFNIWDDYDKFGNVVIWMGVHKSSVYRGLYEPVD
eukprot:429596_1